MVKKGALSALATIGYGLVFVVVVIVTAVGIMIGINGLGEKDEPITGLQISSNKVLDMNAMVEDELQKIGSINFVAKNTLLGNINVNLTGEQINLVLRIGNNFWVYENIDPSNYSFKTNYQSLSMPMCAILTDGKKVLSYGKTTSFEKEPETLIDDYEAFKKNGQQNPTVDTDQAVLNVSTTDVNQQLSFSILGKAELEGDVSSSKLQVVLSIRSSAQGGNILTPNSRPVHFLVTDKNGEPILDDEGNIQITDTITVGINQPYKLVLASYKATNPYMKDAEEKDYIKGGSCYIHARTTNNLWQASPLKVNVDVPIETLKINALGFNKQGIDNSDLTQIINDTTVEYQQLKTNYTVTDMPTANLANAGKVFLYVGDTDENFEKDCYYRCIETSNLVYAWQKTDMQYFIKGDEIKLNVSTFPENALKTVGSMPKIVEYKALNFGETKAKLDTTKNTLTVVGDSPSETGKLHISAKIPQTFNGTNFVEANISINTAQVEVESITSSKEIININVGETKYFSAFELSDAELKAFNLSRNQVVNLGINIKSKHYTHGTDPSSQNISSLVMHYLDNLTITGETGLIDVTPISPDYRRAVNTNANGTISTDSKVVGGKTISLWVLNAKRQNLTGEQINLFISQYSEFDKNNPSAQLQMNVNIVNPTNLQYTERERVMSITKYDDNPNENENKEISLTEDFITYNNAGNLTYTKWVYFLDDVTKNTNKAGSEIVKATTAGQLISQDGRLSETILAVGDGMVSIKAYLVRTDKDGNPIDCRYNIISEDDTTGFVFAKDADIQNDEDAGKYVVEYGDMPCKIIVNEYLEYVKFFFDEELKEEINSQIPTAMGTMGYGANSKVVYLVGNSVMAFYNALGADSVSSGQELIGDLEIVSDETSLNQIYISKESIEDGETLTQLVLRLSIMSGQEGSFKVIARTKSGNSEKGSITIEAKNVEVVGMNIDWTDFEKQKGAITNGEINVFGHLNDGNIDWALDEFNAIPFSLPYKVNYEYNVTSGEGNTEVHPHTNMALDFKVYKLSDEEVESLKNGTLDFNKLQICSTVKVEKIYQNGTDVLSGIKLVLQNGWHSEENLYLAYVVYGQDEVIKAKEFFSLNFKNKYPINWKRIDLSVPSVEFNSQNYNNFNVANNIWNMIVQSIEKDGSIVANVVDDKFSLDGVEYTIKNDIDIYVGDKKVSAITDNSFSINSEIYNISHQDVPSNNLTVSLSKDVQEFFEIVNGLLKVKSGYQFSENSTESAVFGQENKNHITILYTAFGDKNIMQQKQITIKLKGYINKEN